MAVDIFLEGQRLDTFGKDENIEVTKLNRMYIDNLKEYIENK